MATPASYGREVPARAFTRARLLTAAKCRHALQQQLGEERAALLFEIVARAGERALYLVGGVVRDWLLGRPDGGHSDHELDLMLAGPSLQDAIAFARAIQADFGGELRTHARFGTAQWLSPTGIAVDFANARRERYPRPGQLPQPYPGTAEEDLWRRDFSVNALALLLSPPAAFGQLLDPCGGQADLQQRRLRALHPASFRDDPTRILRGLRLAARLGLRWDEETARWAQESLPILARLSGSRLRAEFEQLFREPRPEDALTAKEADGLLPTLHPAFLTDPAVLRERFLRLRSASTRFAGGREAPITTNPVATGWRLLTMGNAAAEVAALAARFTLRKAERDGLERAARLYAERHILADESRPPADIAAALQHADEATRQALWVAGDAALRRQLTRYEEKWRQRRPALSGRDLRRLGLPPGPRYRELLERLQIARWNGEVTSAAEERALLERLVEEGGNP